MTAYRLNGNAPQKDEGLRGENREALVSNGGAKRDRTADLYNAITFRADFAAQKGQNLHLMHHSCTTKR